MICSNAIKNIQIWQVLIICKQVNCNIQEMSILYSGVIPDLVDILQRYDDCRITSVLRLIGTIATGNALQTQVSNHHFIRVRIVCQEYARHNTILCVSSSSLGLYLYIYACTGSMGQHAKQRFQTHLPGLLSVIHFQFFRKRSINLIDMVETRHNTLHFNRY